MIQPAYQEPGCTKPVRCRGRCAYHYRRWLEAQGRIGEEYVCEHTPCGRKFRSGQRRPFCSFDCYLASDRRRRHDRARARRMRKPRTAVRCWHCGTPQKRLPHELKRGRRFCDQICYRAYLAERYDRWVANPQTIETLQGFDEFLSQDTLPCLVEGCRWRGKNLGQHVNREHGIRAEDFKRLAGFNHRTGLVSPATRRAMSALARKLRLSGSPKNRSRSIGPRGASPAVPSRAS